MKGVRPISAHERLQPHGSVPPQCNSSRCSADFSARAIATEIHLPSSSAAQRCSADFSARAIATRAAPEYNKIRIPGVRPISAHERLQLIRPYTFVGQIF